MSGSDGKAEAADAECQSEVDRFQKESRGRRCFFTEAPRGDVIEEEFPSGRQKAEGRFERWQQLQPPIRRSAARDDSLSQVHGTYMAQSQRRLLLAP